MKVKAMHICDICSKENDQESKDNKSDRPNYPQPHNIKIEGDINRALKQKVIERLHGLLKYTEKNNRCKQPRRPY